MTAHGLHTAMKVILRNRGTQYGTQQGGGGRLVQQLVAHQGAQDPVLHPALASRHHRRLLVLFWHAREELLVEHFIEDPQPVLRRS
jgi:hypothetical protein